jgi:3D (Asp-Asp-Asp) domain-containing protein
MIVIILIFCFTKTLFSHGHNNEHVDNNDAHTSMSTSEPTDTTVHMEPTEYAKPEEDAKPTEATKPKPKPKPKPNLKPLLKTINLGEFKLTAYCPCAECCGIWAMNRPRDEYGNEIIIGSSGERLTAGISVAVDTNVIPHGSKIMINGHNYIAHDTGGSVKGNHIDIYFDSHEEAMNFGLQYAEVYMITD